MLEYVFFDQRPYQRFLQFLRQNGVEPETGTLAGAFGLDGLAIQVAEGLGEELEQAIEECYDRLMDWNQQLMDESGGEEGDYHAAGVVLNLKNGKTVYAQVDPGLLGRIMAVVTPEEFGQVVNAIVDAVETPDERGFCRPMRDDGVR